ncbi:NAD(P)-binding protein [Alkalicaulis satelles]|uniref:NAD(P)-binding protein n=1 Tax=Alkalicaulis satelles TaxID=2609175 RepID=A0A5M6ZFC8_9PROT|nr:NAD(P)-binding protein [Alkalicaulis satelles]KAA5800941.1 NAD(P)-binding protein [Alkalicaulis satelles]
MLAAVIGAGLAGAAAARALAAAGADVILFDKGRGPGGRLSTRRAETPLGPVRIDHGAQFVTAETPAFQALLDEAEAAGAAQVWDARLVSIDRSGGVEALRPKPRWIGTGGMNALVRTALAGFDVRFGARAQRLTGGPGAWLIHFDDARIEGPFERVAITLPPEQLIDLLARSDADFSGLIAEARAARIGPCWTVMGVHEAAFDPAFDGAQMLGGAIRWMARMNARPGLDGPECWVLQASPDWSRAFLEDEPETVARRLSEEAFIRFGLPEAVWRRAHRWRYALVEAAPGSPSALDASATLGVGGDWRLGPRAEFAWTSGLALGAALAA